MRLSRYFQKIEEITKFNPGLVRCIRLVLLLLLFCHIFGCVWWYVGLLVQEGQPHDWIDDWGPCAPRAARTA